MVVASRVVCHPVGDLTLQTAYFKQGNQMQDVVLHGAGFFLGLTLFQRARELDCAAPVLSSWFTLDQRAIS